MCVCVWGDGPGSRQYKCPFRVPRIPQEHNARAVPSTAANSTARAETPILRSTYLGQAELSVPPVAFLSFLPPSPSSSGWLPPGALALASGRSGSPGWQSLRAHGCPPAASAAAVRRGVSVSVSGERSLKLRGAVPQEPAGGGSQRASASAESTALRMSPAPRQPQVHPAGERCGWHRGRGPARGRLERGRGLRRRKETGRRGTSFAGVSGSWVF